MEVDVKNVWENLVDFLMPELTPHETSLYVFLLRHSHLASEFKSGEVRIGQRSIAQQYGRGPKQSVPSRQHILRQVKQLEAKGCIRVGDTTRSGTLYEVVLPAEIPSVAEKMVSGKITAIDDDHYNDPVKRVEVYERDNWTCQYCGEMVNSENVTLDHFVPQCQGGSNALENLRTACLMCNSVKSGKSYDEAAVALLENIKSRK